MSPHELHGDIGPIRGCPECEALVDEVVREYVATFPKRPPPNKPPTAVAAPDEDRFDGIFQAIDRMDSTTMSEFIHRFELRYRLRVR